MGTVIKSELSLKNPYWIEKHRYYELKHFCLQYPVWKKVLKALDGMSSNYILKAFGGKANADPVAKCAEKRLYFSNRMKLVEYVAEMTDPDFASYILAGVTDGLTYDLIKLRLDIPCCKDVYYKLYRKFFWLLDKERR